MVCGRLFFFVASRWRGGAALVRVLGMVLALTLTLVYLARSLLAVRVPPNLGDFLDNLGSISLFGFRDTDFLDAGADAVRGLAITNC